MHSIHLVFLGLCFCSQLYSMQDSGLGSRLRMLDLHEIQDDTMYDTVQNLLKDIENHRFSSGPAHRNDFDVQKSALTAKTCFYYLNKQQASMMLCSEWLTQLSIPCLEKICNEVNQIRAYKNDDSLYADLLFEVKQEHKQRLNVHRYK